MGRIASLDFGLKRIGIAISDEKKIIALPLATVHGGVKEVVAFLKPRQKEIETLVVGLPLLMNGTKGEMARIVEAFAKELEAALHIPIVFLDERLSSKGADEALREISLNRKQRSEKIDQMAATLLLQNYLERCNIG